MEKNEGAVSLQKCPSIRGGIKEAEQTKELPWGRGRGLRDLPVALAVEELWGQAGRPQLSGTHILPIFLMGFL